MINSYLTALKTYLNYLSKDPTTLYTAFGIPTLIILLYLGAVFFKAKNKSKGA